MQSNKNGINGESVKQIPREAYKNLGVWAKRVSEILASRREFVAFAVAALIFWFFWIKPKEQETSKKNKKVKADHFSFSFPLSYHKRKNGKP